MSKGRGRRIVLCAMIAATVLLVALGPASARLAIAAAERAAGKGITGSVTYTEVDPGREQGDVLKGVVGKGTFSGKTRGLSAVVATAVVEHVEGVPVGDLLKGGTFVTRYDADARNTYRGIVLGTFASPKLGSVCLSYVTVHGRFTAGSHFIPANVTYKTLGGTGYGARVRANGTMKQTDVTGSSTERLFGDGLLKTVTEGAPRPLPAQCKALRGLAH